MSFGSQTLGVANAKKDLQLYNDLFRTMQKRVYSALSGTREKRTVNATLHSKAPPSLRDWTEYEGTIRQFLVDDKGMVLIACFGIVAHENDSERAARCAMAIAKDLKTRHITSSAGVTTGEVYCGLVGSETRCEYALIGDDVNMAARLMASTQDEIRCDAKTYARSNKHVLYDGA